MSNIYGPTEFVKNVYSLVMTKLTVHKARFIRRPVYIRGRKSMSGCEDLTTGRLCRFDLDGKRATLFIGKNCEMGDMTHIVAHEMVHIGDNVLIASKCFISDTNHGTYNGEIQTSPITPPKDRQLHTKPVKIGNNVWIGENSVILAGSMIGNGVIVGANSVISGVVPDNCIIVGAGRIIKKYNPVVGKWERVIG